MAVALAVPPCRPDTHIYIWVTKKRDVPGLDIYYWAQVCAMCEDELPEAGTVVP